MRTDTRRWLPLGLAALHSLALLTVAGPARAFNHFPPGPTGTCTDTMSILTLKTWLNTATPPCNAATSGTSITPADTMLGVGGIVIGFDQVAPLYDLYLQMQVGGANTGIQVYTAGTDYRVLYGLDRGDSVVVEFACVANVGGDNSLVSPNGGAVTSNLVLRKVSSGNPLPAPLHGDETLFGFFPQNPLALQHVGELVTLDGPLHVARASNIPTNGMYVVVDTDPNDSVYVDCGRLANMAPPPVGTALASVTGIADLIGTKFRIMARDQADLVPAPIAVDLASGTGGANTGQQSFNETRGVDVTVRGATAVGITSMTLRGLYVASASATVGARVYDSVSQALLSSADVSVPSGSNQTVTVPISAALAGSGTYRLCFFVDAGGSGGSGILFDPSPPGSGGFPYNESAGKLTVNQAYDAAPDAFPTAPNIYVPLISVELGSTVGVPGSAPGVHWEMGAVRPDPLVAGGWIELAAPRRARVEVESYSASGKRVARHAETLEPGMHSLPISARGLPPGVYFVRCSAYSDAGALQFRSTRRFVVLGR